MKPKTPAQDRLKKLQDAYHEKPKLSNKIPMKLSDNSKTISKTKSKVFYRTRRRESLDGNSSIGNKNDSQRKETMVISQENDIRIKSGQPKKDNLDSIQRYNCNKKSIGKSIRQPANDRLRNLRQGLQQELGSNTIKNVYNSNSSVTNFPVNSSSIQTGSSSKSTKTNNNYTKDLSEFSRSNHSESDNVERTSLNLFNTENILNEKYEKLNSDDNNINHINEFCDEIIDNSWMDTSTENVPMDWEPIKEEEILKEIKNMRENEDFPKNITINIPEPHHKHTSIGSNYFVVDTNVFLSNLRNIRHLVQKLAQSLSYPFLIVPYIVVQELDHLKIRSDENLARIARESIRYLNKELNSNPPRIQGQNLFYSNEYLIKITNADDKILNCCLQIQRAQNNVILLSNDINLRNKAIINSVDSYSMIECLNNYVNITQNFVPE